MKEADFLDVININLKGTFNCIKHVYRTMMKQKYGRIINFVISSRNRGKCRTGELRSIQRLVL